MRRPSARSTTYISSTAVSTLQPPPPWRQVFARSCTGSAPGAARAAIKDVTYPGLHPAIIERDVWDQVQTMLQAASATRRGASAGSSIDGPAPLKGKLRDETGDLLTPSHTIKAGRRLRYYVSNRLISGGPDPTAWRLPAPELERAIVSILAKHFSDHATRHAVLENSDATTSAAASQAVAALVDRIQTSGTSEAGTFITKAEIRTGEIRIALDADAIATATGLRGADLDPDLLRPTAVFTTRRRGVETRIVAGDRCPSPDATLIRALRLAHHWSDALKTGTPMRQVAARAGVSDRYVARLLPLAGLSPKIQTAILAGTQVVDLTLEHLVRHPPPLAWDAQEHRFGMHP